MSLDLSEKDSKIVAEQETEAIHRERAFKNQDLSKLTKSELMDLIWSDWNHIETNYTDFFHDKWFSMMNRKKKEEIIEEASEVLKS